MVYGFSLMYGVVGVGLQGAQGGADIDEEDQGLINPYRMIKYKTPFNFQNTLTTFATRKT
jgi:hypothetical protein